jgi:hypothetical protein
MPSISSRRGPVSENKKIKKIALIALHRSIAFRSSPVCGSSTSIRKRSEYDRTWRRDGQIDATDPERSPTVHRSIGDNFDLWGAGETQFWPRAYMPFRFLG